MPRTILLCTLLLGGALMSANDTQAQDDTTTSTETTDPVVEALEKEKQKAELQKAIAEAEKAVAEAEKAALAAKLPATEGSGVEGTVTFGEESGYFAEVLAYEALSEAAAMVAREIGPPDDSVGPEILLTVGAEFEGKAQLWRIADVRLADAQERIDDLLERAEKAEVNRLATFEAVGTALTVASGMLSAASDIASFFRSDLSVTARDVAIPGASLVTALATPLRTLDWKPRIPTASLSQTKLLGEVESLLAKRRELVKLRPKLEQIYREERRAAVGHLAPELQGKTLAELDQELKKAEAALEKARKDGKGVAEATTRRNDLGRAVDGVANVKGPWDRISAEIDATLTATDVLVKAITEGADGKPSVAEVVAVVDVALANETWPILRLDLVGQGGEMHVKKSVWGTRLTYVGGVSVDYRLLDQNGCVLRAGVVTVPIGRSMKASEVGTLNRRTVTATDDSTPTPPVVEPCDGAGTQ